MTEVTHSLKRGDRFPHLREQDCPFSLSRWSCHLTLSSLLVGKGSETQRGNARATCSTDALKMLERTVLSLKLEERGPFPFQFWPWVALFQKVSQQGIQAKISAVSRWNVPPLPITLSIGLSLVLRVLWKCFTYLFLILRRHRCFFLIDLGAVRVDRLHLDHVTIVASHLFCS